MKTTLLFLLAIFQLAYAVYDHRPGERYQTMLPNLKPDQLDQLRKIIYDQSQTKGQTFESVKQWIRTQPPNVQVFIKSR